MKFDDIEYLRHGNTKQRRAYKLLTKHGIMSSLSVFDPILVGTIPININIDCSDLDIICYFRNKEQFSEALRKGFGEKDSFVLSEHYRHGATAIVANFLVDDFNIEVFGQNIPTRQQLAYRHMLIEHELLQQKGEIFRQQVIELKQNGVKTEPAFARLLGLTGDPYTELLKFESGSVSDHAT